MSRYINVKWQATVRDHIWQVTIAGSERGFREHALQPLFLYCSSTAVVFTVNKVLLILYVL